MWLVILLGGWGCASQGSTADSASLPTSEPVEPTAAPKPQAEPLPAGLYFRNGYVRWCDYCPASSEKANCQKECPSPTYAVIRGSFGDSRSATKNLRELMKYSLGPGYPFAAPTYRLAPSRDTMRRHRLRLREAVIIAGLYNDKAAAVSLAEKTGSKAVKLMDFKQSFRLLDDLRDGDELTDRAYAIQIGNQPAELISAPSMKKLAEQLRTKFLKPSEYERVFTSACQVPAHSVIVMPRVDYKTVSYAPNQYLPAACPNGQLAFVRRQDTRTDSIVKEAKPGKWQIHQVLSISCDMATTGRWQWGPNGRGIAVTTLASGGC